MLENQMLAQTFCIINNFLLYYICNGLGQFKCPVFRQSGLWISDSVCEPKATRKSPICVTLLMDDAQASFSIVLFIYFIIWTHEQDYIYKYKWFFQIEGLGGYNFLIVLTFLFFIFMQTIHRQVNSSKPVFNSIKSLKIKNQIKSCHGRIRKIKLMLSNITKYNFIK